MDKKKEKLICPYCKLEFTPKRSNQVFTNNDCRIAFNNNKNNIKRKHLAIVNKPLKKDFDILDTLLGKEAEIKVHKEFLRGTGFSFLVFTHAFKPENTTKIYYGLYDIYYYKMDDNQHYKIVRNVGYRPK
jgi:hypothetical protein